MKRWFAVVRENDANDDWGHGSYDPYEAMKMAYEITKDWKDWGYNYIVAAIDEDAHFCDFEIGIDDIIEFNVPEVNEDVLGRRMLALCSPA